MPDYSEFPTTPTAWQEAQWREAQAESRRQLAQQQEAEQPPPARRVDLVALIPGVFFSVLAILFMTGASFPLSLFRDGGVAWILLIGAGVLLLLGEVRKRRMHR